MHNWISFWRWILVTRLGKTQSINSDHTAVAILTTYHVRRLKNIDGLVRSFLKCDFIEKVIVSNHNPEVNIDDRVSMQDDRLVLINQPVRRKPGYRWQIAKTLDARYFIVIDDDFLITPVQIRVLFLHLIEEPGIAHGVTGHLQARYYQNKNMEVTQIHQIYAVTKEMINRYFEITDSIKKTRPDVFPLIEDRADDTIISKAGSARPKIHHIGLLSRCSTSRSPDVAVHLSQDFYAERRKVIDVLDDILQSETG